MNRWFGRAIWAECCRELPQAPVPLGDRCIHCRELFGLDDRGMLLNDGTVPVHRECLMRMVVGSVGHQLGTCHCRGGNEEDPADMTKRQAAIAACELWELWEQRQWIAFGPRTDHARNPHGIG